MLDVTTQLQNVSSNLKPGKYASFNIEPTVSALQGSVISYGKKRRQTPLKILRFTVSSPADTVTQPPKHMTFDLPECFGSPGERGRAAVQLNTLTLVQAQVTLCVPVGRFVLH